MENPNKPTVVTEQNKRFALGPALWAGVIASLVFQGLEILLIPLVLSLIHISEPTRPY